MSKPSEKPLLLYSGRNTPNGVKVHVLLEELKAAYGGPDYDLYKIDTSTGIQKEPWFIAHNPNGRIPVLLDRTRHHFSVFETAAILMYLGQHYDPEKKFTFDPKTEPEAYSEMVQWLFFSHGGVGPMQGQAHLFVAYLPDVNIPYAEERFVNEAKRLYGVLEKRLKDRDYLAGPGRGKYTIADCNCWPWIRLHAVAVTPTLDEWPALKAWVERIAARPAAVVGVDIPAEDHVNPARE